MVTLSLTTVAVYDHNPLSNYLMLAVIIQSVSVSTIVELHNFVSSDLHKLQVNDVRFAGPDLI